MVVVAVFNGQGESSCVLEKMEVGVFESCLQRPKDVIFASLVRKVWLWCFEEWRRIGKRKSREKLENKRLRERMRS